MGFLDKFKNKNEHSADEEKPYNKILNLMQAKKWTEALALNEKFFDKNSEADWYSRGNLLTNLDRRKEAIDCYQKAIDLKDTYIKAWFRLGQRYFEFGNFKEARDALVQASVLEQKIGENEWNTLTTFYYMMALHFDFLNTKNEKIRENIPNEIRKLRKVIEVDKNISDEKFLVYCSDNFQKIIVKLEPEIVADFRHPESIN